MITLRLMFAMLFIASTATVACSSSDREPSPAARGSVAGEPAPKNAASGPPEAVAAVCDTVAARWQRANTAFMRTDSVAQVNSMTGSAPVCVVTAVAEDDPARKLMSFSYWSDSTKQGWRGITRWDADGSDGTSRTLARAGVRCQVDGEWDGGDDADPTAVRSKRVNERTTCWGDPAGLMPRDTSTMS